MNRLCPLSLKTLDAAIEIANDTIYGLAGYVIGGEPEKLKKVASSIWVERIIVNKGTSDYSAPFGGYKQSGIGREWGDYGIEEYLEIKSVLEMYCDKNKYKV